MSIRCKLLGHRGSDYVCCKMWSVINSEYELDDEEREEYAFRIYCDEARARARAKSKIDLQRVFDRRG